MGAAASCGICLGTTFALCTTAAPVADVHQPVRRRDAQEGGRRHGDGNPGHGGAHPRDEMHHVSTPRQALRTAVRHISGLQPCRHALSGHAARAVLVLSARCPLM